MARPISDEELQLKRRARRRLIGAIVLVTAIVVALPMVLDTEPKPIGGEISIKIPPPDSSKFSSRPAPVAPAGEPGPSAAGEKSVPDAKSSPRFAAAVGERPPVAPDVAKPPASGPPAKAAPPAAAESQAKAADAVPAKAPPPPAEPPAPPAPAAKAAPAPAAPGNAGETFAVQVIALADSEKVKQVQAQIATAGLKSYTEVVKTSKGDVTRIRVAPYPSRAAAEKAHDQLKAIGLGGNIVPK